MTVFDFFYLGSWALEGSLLVFQARKTVQIECFMAGKGMGEEEREGVHIGPLDLVMGI